MKTYVMSSDRLEGLVERLWEKAEERNISICITPKDKRLAVVENGATIAMIEMQNVVDEYDIVSDLF